MLVSTLVLRCSTLPTYGDFENQFVTAIVGLESVQNRRQWIARELDYLQASVSIGSSMHCGSFEWTSRALKAPWQAREEFSRTVNDSTNDLVNFAIRYTGVCAGESRAQGGQSLFSERLECAAGSCRSNSSSAQEARGAPVDSSLAPVLSTNIAVNISRRCALTAWTWLRIY